MAKLTAAKRHSMLMKTPKEFALPGGRFPIPDKGHARDALMVVGQSEAKGNISASQAATVRAKARAKLKGK